MIKKEIAEKLFKAELSEQQKVELASDAKAKELAKDFRRAESGLKEKKKVLEDLVQELEAIDKLKAKADKEYKETLDLMNIYLTGKDRYDNIYDGIKKKADELGVDVNQIPSISELNKAYDEAADAYRPIQRVASKIFQILD